MDKFFKRPLLKGENKMLAGVCSGISQFLGINPFWIRFLFLTLTSFTSLDNYIILIYVLLVFSMEEK